MVDTIVLETIAVRRGGSSPLIGTICLHGGIGRRDRLKICCYMRASSSLAGGT